MTAGPAAPLRAIVELLDRAAIPHMVVGSFASMVHGVPRTTQDLYIVIDPSAAALEQFLREIDTDRFYIHPDVALESWTPPRAAGPLPHTTSSKTRARWPKS